MSLPVDHTAAKPPVVGGYVVSVVLGCRWWCISQELAALGDAVGIVALAVDAVTGAVVAAVVLPSDDIAAVRQGQRSAANSGRRWSVN